MEQNTIHKKSINNAISAYLMLFISGLFLFNKKNEYLNNDFVKNHTKTALLIHLGFLLNYIIFISFGFLKNILVPLINYNLNYILASLIFTFLFITLLYGIYKANKQETFRIGDLFSIGKVEKIIDINGDGIINEKDKLTLILSYIPFIGYIVGAEHNKEKNVSNIIKLNLYFSFILTLIYISGNKNIVLLFGLFYIIFVVFSSINIIIKEKIIGLNLDFLPFPSEIFIKVKSFCKYLFNYFGKKEFINISEIYKKDLEKYKKVENKNSLELSKFEKSKIPNILNYIPIINLFLIFTKKNNKYIAKINGLIISIFFIILLILNFYNIINSNLYILLLFPIFFGYGFIDSRPAYKIPIIYNFYEILVSIKNIFKKTKKTIKEKQAEVHSETIKIK